MGAEVFLRATRRKGRAKQGQVLGGSFRAHGRARQRRAAEEVLSQRLYAIILAAHAAENGETDDTGRLACILNFIRTQSAASLDEVRRLSALG